MRSAPQGVQAPSPWNGAFTARQRGIDMEQLLHDGTGCCICESWHRHATLGHQIHLLDDRSEPPSPPVQR